MKDNYTTLIETDTVSIKENHPKTPETEEERAKVIKIQDQARRVVSGEGFDPESVSDEDLASMGISKEELDAQMKQYQKMQAQNEAHAHLGYALDILMKRNPELGKKLEEGKIEIYDELYDCLINTAIDTMQKQLEEAYVILANKIEDVLENEAEGKPLVKLEDRLSYKMSPVKPNYFDGVEEEFIPIRKELVDILDNQSDNITSTIVSAQILKFVWNTSLMEEMTKEYEDILYVEPLLQSIALGKTTSSILDEVRKRCISIEQENKVNVVLAQLFPTK